jgi:diaminohydroxyphosphoribosylaminopyrimidine deaminase / 5-amino-6-(5-phosphoribosylamino)uracil reductase
MPNTHQLYMHRCLQLALLGAGHVAPNPLVGAVLVYNGVIIGEGYHQQFGGPHAEVNCINSVAEKNRQYISQATLYVSLEPCAHFGKTPPCANLIIANKIKKVVIGCADTFDQVNGKGIQKLLANGIDVTLGVLVQQCIDINKAFFEFNKNKRPYIILKWAQAANGFIADNSQQRTLITNQYTNRLVHKWRAETAAILVGTNTALKDNPSLNTRLWPVAANTRIIIDLDLKVPATHHIYDGSQKTIVFNAIENQKIEKLTYIKLERNAELLHQICTILHAHNIQSILVEGGAKLLQAFITNQLFNEIRVIENTNLHITQGIAAPVLPALKISQQYFIQTDKVTIYK